jgi:hypothetical protein
MAERKIPGIDIRHGKSCASRNSGACDCHPTFQAHVYDARSGRRIRTTFSTITAAKRWRQEAMVALRSGAMRPPTVATFEEVAATLSDGIASGAILDRSVRQAVQALYVPKLPKGA